MNKIKEFFRDRSILEKAWLIFVCSLMTVMWFINGGTPLMLVLSLTGSPNLVLGAKDKVAGLYSVIINSVMYAYQCLGTPLYGEVVYNVLYSILVSVTAIRLWKKNVTSGGEVRFRTMTFKLVTGVAIATAVGAQGYSESLKYTGGSSAFMDPLTTAVSVIVSMLYLLCYSKQWLMWVIINVLSIIMWIMVFVLGDTTVLPIIVMKIVNLLNSLCGYMNWRKISQKIAK